MQKGTPRGAFLLNCHTTNKCCSYFQIQNIKVLIKENIQKFSFSILYSFFIRGSSSAIYFDYCCEDDE